MPTTYALKEVFVELLPGKKYYAQLIVGTTTDYDGNPFEYVYSAHMSRIEAACALASLLASLENS